MRAQVTDLRAEFNGQPVVLGIPSEEERRDGRKSEKTKQFLWEKNSCGRKQQERRQVNVVAEVHDETVVQQGFPSHLKVTHLGFPQSIDVHV